tara:strand:- start:168 stop:401 length:234 start_codon:yes stop_codon:yes gene_type:complete
MDKIKALQTERDNLMSTIDQKDVFINKIKSWLISEVNHQQPIIDGEEILTDGTDDICEGRHECAEGLLNQIEEWENK